MTLSAAIGVQGAQSSTSVGRGLARYVADSVLALAELEPRSLAGLLFDPSLPLPAFFSNLPATVKIGTASNKPKHTGQLIYHAPSPFELLSLEMVWPEWARNPDVGLVVTVHDLIPFIYPERYLHIDNVLRWHAPRLGMLQVADALIAISESTAADAVERLHVDPARIFVTHEDCSDAFRPASMPNERIFSQLKQKLPQLRPDFILYVGGLDFRKNVTGLIDAYALLPPAAREHQLVFAGKVHPDETEPLMRQARRLGVLKDITFTGYITDEVLIELYQTCGVFVFPSFHEGFGLPVLEAMRCSAPVIVADATSLRELVTDPLARFDPSSPPDIARLLTRALGDAGFRKQLRAMAAHESARYSWKRSVRETIRAYEFAGRRRVRLGARPRD